MDDIVLESFVESFSEPPKANAVGVDHEYKLQALKTWLDLDDFEHIPSASASSVEEMNGERVVVLRLNPSTIIGVGSRKEGTVHCYPIPSSLSEASFDQIADHLAAS